MSDNRKRKLITPQPVMQLARVLADADGMMDITDNDLVECGYVTMARTALDYLSKSKQEKKEKRPLFDREKELARRILADDNLSYEDLAKECRRSIGHIGQQVMFGALLLQDEDAYAKILSDLTSKRGIGPVKALKLFRQKKKSADKAGDRPNN